MIASAIEKLASLELAESWDNVGLLVGSPEKEVKKALLTLDVTAVVIEEAAEKGAGVIIAHHPFPFRPMKNVRTDTSNGNVMAMLLKRDISVYAAHTNLDAAEGGVNDALSQALHLQSVLPLRPVRQSLVKIVAYVPPGHVEAVWQAMSGAGAGHVGKYSQCGFRVTGTGTFLPEEGASPYIGKLHQLSTVEEVRIETVAPVSLSAGVVQALLDAHPYEEVAYDVYSLQNDRVRGGLGRVGDLAQPRSLRDFVTQVKMNLGVPGIRFVGADDTRVQRVAVCGGSGMDVAEAARRSGAQVLVTGDIRYHDAQDALASGLCLVDAGHFGTEYPVLAELKEYLRVCSVTGAWDCLFEISERQADIWQWL